jgi:gliding motility associated protien GldN
MKMKFLKPVLFAAVAVSFFHVADAQRSSKRRGNNPATNPTTPAGNDQQQVSNNTQPSNFDAYASLPLTYDTTATDNSSNKSLRPQDAFDKSMLNSRTPLPYEHLRWDDALYSEKVWRELDLREKINKVFMYEAKDDNGSQVFVNMLLDAVHKGEVTPFTDDRFTTPMTTVDVDQLTAGSADTVLIRDLKDMDKIVGRKVVRNTFDATTVTRIRLKEQWIFDRESSRMFCRILGIGLYKTEYIPNTNKERGVSSLFWLYYPDLRPMLAKAEVYNPKNMGQSRMTWEELFESRMFGSYIVKSTIENPGDKMIKNYIKDPILALLEGDNIKEKIFNFEQDLWSY